MSGRIHSCLWFSGASKDEQTREHGNVLHFGTSDCRAPNTGRWLHNLEERATADDLCYMNPEKTLDGVYLNKDPHAMLHLAATYRELRPEGKGVIQCPGYSSPANHKPRKSFQRSWAREHMAYAEVYELMGSVAVPMYRRDLSLTDWLATVTAWAERMAWFAGDIEMYVMTGVRQIGAKPTPWVEPDEFAMMCESCLGRGVGVIVFDRFDSETDLQRGLGMVAGVGA